MSPLSLLRLVRSSAAPASRPAPRRLGFEELESRALLSASALLTRIEAVEQAGKAARFSLPLTADRLAAPGSGRVFYQIEITPTEGSDLDLKAFRVLDSLGRHVGGRFVRHGQPLVGLALLKHGDFTLEVLGRGDSVGSFRTQVRLVGDADGDRDVQQDDLQAIAAALGRRPSGLVGLDADGNGRVDAADLNLASRNLGAASKTITFNIANSTGAFTSAQISVAFYGQDSQGKWYYLDASGKKISTIGLKAVPTFTLSKIPSGLEVSNAAFFSGRILLGAGATVVAPIVNGQGAVAAPNPGNATDPDNNLYNDIIEYTVTGGAVPNLNIDTSQVDAFGFPITLQMTPTDPNSPSGVGVNISRAAVFAAFHTYAQGTPFAACLTTPATGPQGPYRILSPQDVLQLNPGAALTSYFNAALDAFFTQYQHQTLTLTHDNVAYQGRTTQIQTEGRTYTAMQFTGGGNTFNVYYPFFTTNPTAGYTPHFAAAPPPSWIVSSGKQAVAPSEMVFANNGVFADNVGQFPSNANLSVILGNLENQIVSALSRGVALTPVADWGDFSKFFPTGGTWNRYAAFWHQPSISIGGKAYGFPFDDQGGHSSDLSVNNPQSVTITLGSWT